MPVWAVEAVRKIGRRSAQHLRESVTHDDARRALKATGAFDVTALLSEVRTSTLVIHRREIPWLPVRVAESLAAGIEGARLTLLEGEWIAPYLGDSDAAAKAIGEKTRFPSLELGTEPSSQGGRCDSGYSCIYTSNMSWRTPTSPMTKEINPRAVFDRLFGNSDKAGEQKSRAKRDRYRKSILDLVAEDASDLKRKLGAGDVRKLDEFTFAVRQIEKQIEESEKLATQETDVPDFPRPAGVPRDFGEHVRLMMDMMVLAMQTDSTRTLTFMYTNAGSNRSYNVVDVRRGHHTLSHHGRDREKQADISKINRYHSTLLAHFLDRLAGVKEAGGTLLDHSMVLFGSGLGDGNRHNHDNLPILLAGRGGSIKSGRHVRYPFNTPLTNLYRSMLSRAGATTDKYSDSTGPLDGLS